LVKAFADDQKARGLRDSTLHCRLRTLADALRMMAPEMDVRFITHPGNRPLRQIFPPVPRRVEVRDSRELLQYARDLHDQGLKGTSYDNGNTALRDAALLGLLACHGTRCRAVHEMRIEQNLFYRDGRYWARFSEANTKMGRSYELPLPDALTPLFDDYLRIARPALGGAKTDCLWVSVRQGPLSKQALAAAVAARTRAWTGTPHGPHWLRKCLTTTVRMTAPELALDTAIVLDHSMAVAQQHYDMGTGVAAAMRHSARMSTRVKETESRANAAFRCCMSEPKFQQFRRKSPIQF